ncbi:MAG: CoA transferase [bacterium]|nr:CoA transferase [bacterium]
MAEAALEGVRVVELGSGVSAPYCTKLLADFGAECLKIEPVGRGDEARRWGPFPGDHPHPEKSGLFFTLNTNKRSITLDPDDPSDQAALIELVNRADFLIENQPIRELLKWGLDYDALAASNPDLIMISITPYGRTGPYADWKGHDLNAFHLSAAGNRYCGRPGEAPLEHGTYSADYFGGVAAAAWGLAAYFGRDRVGGGQFLDVSCAEVIAATFVGGLNIGGVAQDGVFERRTGVGMPLAAPATMLPTRDGYVWMLALEPGQWKGLSKVMGDPDWMQVEIFDDMFGRGENADFIYSMFEEWTRERSKWEIMERCQEAGVPVTAVFTVAEAADHPHIAARGYVVELDHPALGRVRNFGVPFRMSETPGGPERPAPLLGEHREEILRDGWPTRSPRPRRSTDAPLTSRRLPLEGIRVANFGWVWAGPIVGQTLRFLGAEVIKIESHERLDFMRTLPPFAGPERDSDRSLSNHACWAGNESVTLNLRTSEGRDLARDLIRESDVVIENFGPGVMQEMGIDFERARTLRPNLVMCSLPAAGLNGPLKGVRTYGLSLTSITGLDSLTGYTGGPPIPVECAFSDPYTGILGACAIMTALVHRDRTGSGQHIDLSQQEAVMQMVAPAFMDYVLNGRVGAPLGNQHPGAAAAPHGVFPCAGEDRWISIVVTDDEEWAGLRKAIGAPAWANGSNFSDLSGRLRHIEDLHDRLARFTVDCDDRELASRLQAHGVAAAPVLCVGDLLDDPHWRARNTFIEVHHPLGFDETIYGAYVKTSRSDVLVEPGPAMGQHNERVYRELLGLSEERYRDLIARRVIH